MEVQRGFTRRFNYRGLPQDDPVLAPVFNDDFDGFCSLVESDRPTYGNDSKLLYYVIKLKRWNMFSHILGFDEFNPNSVDNIGRSVLMNLASLPSSEEYARALIDKGADVNRTDVADATYLHMAAKENEVDNTKIGQLVIEKGANINAQTRYGETPCFLACMEGNIDFIHLLMFYGADVTIASDRRILPIVATGRWVYSETQKYIQDLLFDYTFDDAKTVVEFATLTEAMLFDTTLFSRMIEKTSDVTYDMDDLENFCHSMKYVKLRNLRLFVEKFDFLAREIFSNCPLLTILLELGWVSDSTDLKGILDIFLESEFGCDLVQNCRPGVPALALLVGTFHEVNLYIDEEEITKTACLMISYGLEVTSRDLDVVYRYYGNCELFKILLHMDIVLLENQELSVARLFYDVNASIEEFLETPAATSLLDYYNHSKLKETILSRCHDQRILVKVKAMPQIPSLLELSRNVARTFLVTWYQIKNSRQFYTVVKQLPIGSIQQRILSLEHKLYNV